MSKTLLKEQPKKYRKKLPNKKITISITEVEKRVLFYDPTPLYKTLIKNNKLNPHKRYNYTSMSLLFPQKKKYCACGCGKKLTGRKRKWASKACNQFAYEVYSIIAGNTKTIVKYKKLFNNQLSCKCELCDHSPTKKNPIELDHIWPIKWGGGGTWLSNYQLICKKCHHQKTNNDLLAEKS